MGYLERFSDRDQPHEAEDYIRTRNAKNCRALLGLLAEHHAEHCPEAASEYFRSAAPTPKPEPPPPPPPIIVAVPSEEDRIAEWVSQQKQLSPALRAWNEVCRGPSIISIQRAVCREFNVSLTDLVSARRTWNLTVPRQLGIYFARTLTTHSFPSIARKFGKRDHTTAYHAYRQIQRKLAADPAFAERAENIRKILEPVEE